MIGDTAAIRHVLVISDTADNCQPSGHSGRRNYYNPTIKNAMHIRASVILHWLGQHNKRQVQYMAGHKYITSTEMYQVQELETLTNQLNKHHPFG